MTKTGRQFAVPLYQQISEDIIRRILTDEFSVGSPLPSEISLSEQYSASRITIRQALDKLETEGFISKSKGKCSVVKAKPSFTSQDLFIPRAGVKRNSDVHNSNVRFTVILDPPVSLTDKLCISKDSPIVMLNRDFIKENRVIGINTAWFPLSIVSGITELPLIENSISQTLQKRYGISFSNIDNYIESVSLDSETAERLGSSILSPALKISSLYYNEKHIPVEYSETIWNGQYTKFHILL